MPKVSVVISSYNHAPYIGQAIQSVLDQTFQDFEIVIADDASTDNTLEVIDQFNDPRIRVFPFTENRKAHMKNECLKEAKGEYIAILNSDDYMAPDRLGKQLAFLETHVDHEAVFSPVVHVDHEGKILRQRPTRNLERHQWLRHFLDNGNALGHSCAMIRKEFFDEHGPYNRWQLLVSDLDLWVRICLHAEIHVIDEPLTFLRVLPGESNLSGNTTATKNRLSFELPTVIDHFFEPTGLAQLAQIFPDHEIPTDTTDRIAFLATYLSNHKHPTVRFRANQHVYDLVNAPGEHSLRLIKTYYAAVAQTSYDDANRLPRCSFSIKKVNSGEIETISTSYLRYGQDITLTFEGTVTEKSAILFQPADLPCVIRVKELKLSGVDCLQHIATGGTAIKLKNGLIVNLENRPLIKILPKRVPKKGSFTYFIRFDLEKGLKSLSPYLATR